MIVKEVTCNEYLTKSNLHASDYVINPYVGCPAWLQILLCFIHEKVYWTQRRLGNIYIKNNKNYWRVLANEIKYCDKNKIKYINYFYHEELVKNKKESQKK